MKLLKGKLFLDSATGKLEFHYHGENGEQTLMINTVKTDELPEFGRSIEALITEPENDIIDWQYQLTDIPTHSTRDIVISVGWGHTDTEEISHEQADEWANILASEARRIGREKWNVLAYGAGYRDSGYSGLMKVKWQDLASAVNERYPDRPDNTHSTTILPGASVSLCGQAILGGTISFSRRECATFGMKTPIHEALGHSIMGLEHAAKGSSEYGESDTWMGSSSSSNREFSTPHLYQAGLVEHNNVLTLVAGESVETWLVQGHTQAQAMRLGENKAVICHVASTGVTRRIMVSYYKNTIRIHRPGFGATTNWVRTDLLAKLRRAGETFETNGVTVEVLELSLSGGKVRVYNQTTSLPRQAPNPVWAEPGQDSPVIGDWARGQWGHPEWATVQGIHFGMTSTGKPVLHWLTWNDRIAGTHEWYWAVCDLQNNGRLVTGDLLTADHYGRVSTVGTVRGYWYNNSEGIIRVEFANGDRATCPIRRVFQAHPDSRAGYYGIGNAQGLTLSLNQSGHGLAYWLSHENSRQIWRMCIGSLDSMIVYEVEGGQRSVKAPFKIRPTGTATISNNADTFTINLDGKTSDQRTMRKLA